MNHQLFISEQFQQSARIKQQFVETYREMVWRTADIMSRALQNGGKLLICGNGGSAADAQHFAAEMIGRLTRDRAPIPAMALSTDTSILTAIANDYSVDDVFSRQVQALGTTKDILIALSTSGNSPNVIKAVEFAKQRGLYSIALLGKGGGTLASLVDDAMIVPSHSSQRIQEVHITVIHTWCELIEDVLYPKQE